MDEAVDTVLGVQFNVFECGGMAIGICISHKIADALSYFQFVKSWATVTRGGNPEHITTHFESSALFPPKHMPGYDPDCLVPKEKIVCNRFVFEASAVESLRSKYSEKVAKNILEGQKPPSRVEVLSTFIWTRFLEATKGEKKKKKEAKRKDSVGCMGSKSTTKNGSSITRICVRQLLLADENVSNVRREGECHDMGRKLREELNKMDKGFIAKLRECEQWNPQQKKEEMVRSTGGGEEGEIAVALLSLHCVGFRYTRLILVGGIRRGWDRQRGNLRMWLPSKTLSQAVALKLMLASRRRTWLNLNTMSNFSHMFLLRG
ncbi:salutaridinol 7-O-acetyltransferase-like [Neltuma alba]|uniref:salutaridinol 7-O-acetyltransferase-like n=1 Tax=Neltuma alba TaxID=207710 RepID=UPI0010A4EFB0|nr:salutaridinol 7-O-acetyltransferase-like [Prosopis alba]